MAEVALKAEMRKGGGQYARRMRKEGRVPGVFYAAGETPLSIEVPSIHLGPLIYTSQTHVINLAVGSDAPRRCILRDVQFDPVSDKPIHFDLQGLREGVELTIEVPVVLTGGTPKGVREGGVLQHMMHKIEVSCLPKDIPEHLEINVADMDINTAVHVRDVAIPNVTIQDPPEATIVAVFPPTVEKEPVPTEAVAEEAAEPEVVGKGKKAEEGEEGEAGEGDKKPEKAEKKADKD